MFKTWTASDDDPQALARALEGHLNEFALEVVSVGCGEALRDGRLSASGSRPERSQKAAVSVAEEIVEQAQA